MPDTTPPDEPLRIPLAHSVRYVARGLPEVPNQYGPGILAPSEITLTYRSGADSQLGRVHAYVAGRIWVDGVETPLLPGGLYGQHYDEGLSNWPEWLAEEARLHDPATISGPAPAPTDQTALCALVDGALHEVLNRRLGKGTWTRLRESATTAVLAVLPAPTDRDAIRAAALREAADYVGNDDDCTCGGCDTCLPRKMAAELRRRADELQAQGGSQPRPGAEARPPQHSWRVETRDPLADEWAPGSHFASRPHAVERYETANSRAPRWKDGTPVERRIVRETTTYTVEEPQPAATAPQPETSTLICKCPAEICGCGHHAVVSQPDEEPWFGMPGCTCKPWTVEDGQPRYLEPRETVDKVSGWARRADCPHHQPDVVSQPGTEA